MAATAFSGGQAVAPLGAGVVWSPATARCELKYWATEAQAAALMRVAEPHVMLDPLALHTDVRGSWNVSLYLDSPGLSFLEQHLAAVPDRVKLRVRTYATAGDVAGGGGNSGRSAPAFLEIKRKVGTRTFKQRTVVTRADALAIVGRRFDQATCLRGPLGAGSLETFLFLQERHAVQPTVLVRARRRSFVGADDPEAFRMTLDREIGYQRTVDPDLAGRPRGWTTVERAGPILVELKFCRAAPAWVGPALDRLGLAHNAFSKYLAAMVQDLSPPGATDPVSDPTALYGSDED